MSYNQIGDIVMVANTATNIEKLNPETYLIQYNERMGYHLKRVDPLKLPEKVYGDNPHLVEKVLRLFEDEVGRTSGVMLHGAKGTGKTLTAVGACIEANKRGYPVLLLQSQFYGSDFNDFMANVDDSCLVFIDEFEKVFEEQDAINSTLMLLDGAVKTHKLFILTSNQKLDEEGNGLEFLANRPSRVFYSIYYGTMDDAVITEYLQDNLINTEYLEDILAFKRSFRIFTIDILKAIVVEVNRYGASGVSFGSLMKHMNVKTDRGLEDYAYTVRIKLGETWYNSQDVVKTTDTWKVSGTSLANVLDSESYGNELEWTLLLPASMSDHLRGLSKKSAFVYFNGDEHDMVDGEMKVIGVRGVISMHHHYYKQGRIIAEQDKTTRAITLSDVSGVVKIEFTPIIDSQKSVSEFII